MGDGTGRTSCSFWRCGGGEKISCRGTWSSRASWEVVVQIAGFLNSGFAFFHFIYLRAAAPAADPGFSGPAFPPLVGIARVFRTGVSVVLLKVALLESSFLSGVEVGARAERFIACSLDCLLAFSTTNQPPKKHLKPPLRHGFNPLSSAPKESQFLGRSVSNGRSGFLEKRQFASIFHH